MPSDSRDVVLVLTHTRDEYVTDRVDAGLRARGARSFRLDTDEFPRAVRLTTRYDGGWRRTVRVGDRSLDLDDVRAVWARKVWSPQLDPGLDAAFRASCEVEVRAALIGVLDGLGGVPWVNSLSAVGAANDKLRQLRVARDVGLAVPATLVSNDPDEVLAFADAVASAGDTLVAKLLTALTTSMGAPSVAVRTSRVPPEALTLDALAGLRHAPMVFQAEIAKRTELRVAVVGGRVLAGEVVAAADPTPGADVDWRRGDATVGTWRPAAVPATVAEALVALHRALGLVYGAVDLIVTPDDRYVFLETNPGGEWGMLERDAGLPVGDALAAALLEPAAAAL